MAVINGESISRSELKTRLGRVQAILERQHGMNLFSGERGRALLESLENEVLEEMLEERLVAQEARRLGIQVSEEKVQNEFQRVCKEIYGPAEDFSQRLEEDGVRKEDLQDHIRTLLYYKALKAAKVPEGADPDLYLSQWLVQAKQGARIAIYNNAQGSRNFTSLRGGCCSVGQNSGGCSGEGRSGRPLDAKTEGEAQRVALEAYRKTNPKEQGVTAKVTDYGCHIQVDIHKEGKVVKSYSYQDGKVFEDS